MAFVDQGARSKLPSVLAVALVHGAIGYAFISGLAYNVIKETIPIFTVESIRDTPTPPDVPPPPPEAQPQQERVTTMDPLVRSAQVREVVIEPLPPLEQIQIINVDPLPPPPERPAPPAATRTVQPKGDKAAWITTDDYPAGALRNEEEGTVGIAVTVDPRGRVADCRITQSSGFARLDEATCRTYARRARFTPALDAGGAAVAASFADRVRWQIPR